MIYTVTGQNHSINQFKPNSVAYIEDCGDVSEIASYWNLAIRTNLDVFYQNVDQLHSSFHDLKKQCRFDKENSICEQVILNFEKRLQTITQNEKAIKNKIAMRNKRGLGMFALGAILGGLVYKWVINPTDTANLQSLLDKQTSVIDFGSTNNRRFRKWIEKYHGAST